MAFQRPVPLGIGAIISELRPAAGGGAVTPSTRSRYPHPPVKGFSLLTRILGNYDAKDSQEENHGIIAGESSLEIKT